MDDKKIRLIVGSLLHDIGKILYRYNDGRNHSTSGYDFLKENGLVDDTRILNCVKYHHSLMLKNSGVSDDDSCYITYIADNIASFSDRRKNETGESGFVRDISFESIFNILNGNNQKLSYDPSYIIDIKNDSINYPTDKEIKYSEEFYSKVALSIKEILKGNYLEGYVDSLLESLEAYTSFIPSSTQTGELCDISLFAHLKLTAAISACVYDFTKENKITDLKQELYKNADKFYDKKSFILFSADVSGIQNFIYNISSKSALKGLRSRSFYLDMIIESVVDMLLDRLELTRCNVIYSGGGHTFILLPCTQKTKDEIMMFEKELNQWFLDYFDTELYIGTGFCECSANDFRNIPDGSYEKLFSTVSRLISDKKLRRYSANQLRKLNSHKKADNDRECAICKRSDRLISVCINEDKTYICEICNGLKNLSNGVLDGDFFTVLDYRPDDGNSVPLPFDKYLVADSKEKLIERMKNDKRYVRSYGKNKMYSGMKLASKLWVGDYYAQKQFSELIKNCNGIERLGVLRADVDNLGKAFVSGFDKEHVTLSRTAELSKRLSMFFKYHINHLMKNGEFSLYDKQGKRNAVIIYSGGDDVFIVGGWDDVIGFAVDLHNCLSKYSQGTLTISAGIGMYSQNYPIYSMAKGTEKLEEISKQNTGKDSVTLFSHENCYKWDEFINKVVGEKLDALDKYLNVTDEKGKGMLYNILNLIRDTADESRLNIARFVYYIARLAPEYKEENEQNKEKLLAYRKFSVQMYSWVQNPEDRRQLITAIYLYIYKIKNTDDNQKKSKIKGDLFYV